MSEYHGIIIPQHNIAVVRPADWGVTDQEWLAHARVAQCQTISCYKIQRLLEAIGYRVLTQQEWTNEINLLTGNTNTNCDSNYSYSPFVDDKWDQQRPIY